VNAPSASKGKGKGAWRELPGKHAVPFSSSSSVLPSLVSVIVSSTVARKQLVPAIGPLTLVKSTMLVASPNPTTVPSPHWTWSQGFEAGTPEVYLTVHWNVTVVLAPAAGASTEPSAETKS